MDKLKIKGPTRISGKVRVSGSKNAALPCLAACLLSDKEVVLDNVPRTRDLATMEKLLGLLGAEVRHENGTTHVRTAEITSTHAPYDLVKTMRASVLVLGPLAARCGEARVSLPGGCAIGARPVDEHLAGLERLGAVVEVDHGDIVVRAPNGLVGTEISFRRPTVGGTENLIMAASIASGTTRLVNCAREPEIIDLADLLVTMGAKISGAGSSVIDIEGVASLGGAKHRVIPDRIEAGTWLVAALTAGEGVEIQACRPDHMRAVIDLFRDAGGEIEVHDDRLVVPRMRPMEAQSVRTAEYPGFPTDLQAQVMLAMTQCEGTSTITETIFENRFQHVPELQRMGADVQVAGRAAVIAGPNRLEGARVMATDLRASACLVLAGLLAEGETVIDRIYHLDRGYETIGAKLEGLGATIERFNPGPFL